MALVYMLGGRLTWRGSLTLAAVPNNPTQVGLVMAPHLTNRYPHVQTPFIFVVGNKEDETATAHLLLCIVPGAKTSVSNRRLLECESYLAG